VVDPVPGIQLFASVATSFETPTTTELTNRPDGSGGFNPELDPTRGLSVEGGVRGRLGEVWTVEATTYRTSLDEELIPFEVPSQPGRTFFRNAGESRHTGFELTVDGRLAPELPMRVAYTRVDGRFEEYEVEGEDFSGNRLPGIAPNRVDGRVAWEPRGLGFVEFRGLWQDDVPVNDANTASSPSYFLADVRGGLEGIEAGEVVVAPWAAVTNVLDRRYNTAVTVNAFGGRYFEPGPGRSVRVGLRLTWGTR
jgi:iron complex outermembrane receptor protein